MLWAVRVSTTGGTILKGCSIGKVEDHCAKGKKPGRKSELFVITYQKLLRESGVRGIEK